MDDVLKKLLDTEVEAEKLVTDAEARHGQIVEQAREEARAAETKLSEQVPEIRRVQINKAEERAEQTIAELKRRYAERQRELHATAEQRLAEAAEAALGIVLDPQRN